MSEQGGAGGVPNRPAPLPPPSAPREPLPRPVAPGRGEAATTVVPQSGQQAAPPRAPLTRPVSGVRGRRAKLALRRLDPWSVFIMSLLLSLFLAVVTIVASLVLYTLLSALGVLDTLNEAIIEVNGGGQLLTRGRFLGVGALIAAANVVLLTVLATLGALIYNVCATFTGGVELTLAERS